MDTNIKILALMALMMVSVLPLTAQDASAKLEEQPLYIYGDSVRFTAEITVTPHWVMSRDGYYRIMPELGDTKFPEIHIPSEDLGNARKNGINVTITSSAPFVEDMIGNDLEIETEYVYKDGKKNREFEDMDDLGECCITIGKLFSMNGQYELMEYDYTPPRSVPLKVVAQINFPINVSEFPESEYRDQIAVIGDYLKKYNDASIMIRGFASPEGPTERNKELSEERAMEAKNWLINTLNEKGYSRHFDRADIKVETTTEDWKGFVRLVRNSEMPANKQAEIINIVSTTPSLKEAEDELYNIVGDYQAVKEFMRPLRRATVVVFSESAYREGMTSEEIADINTQMMKGDMPVSSYKDVFSQEEFLQAYVQNDAPEGKVTILTSYNKVYPGDMRIYSDLAALTAMNLEPLDIVGGDDALVDIGFSRDLVDIDTELDIDEGQIEMEYQYKEEDVENPKDIEIDIQIDRDELEKKMQQVEGYLVKVVEADETNFVALNNLGAYYLTNGQLEKARKFLEMSYSVSANQQGVNYNLGVVHAFLGNIEKAHEHFEKADEVRTIEYNRGIARYLTGDYEGALDDFMNFSNRYSEYAIGHYLAAAAAAKTGDKETMIERLKFAINRNKNLADVAEEDLMFREHWDHDAFEDATDEIVSFDYD